MSLPDDTPASPEHPIYRRYAHNLAADRGTQLFFIVCDEGWRSSIVCERMYEWAAEWLIDTLDRTPYAKEH